VSIVCQDEASASQLFELLSASKFEEAGIDSSLTSESLIISAIENLKKKTKSFKNPNNSHSGFPVNYMGNMNNFNQMYNFNPYANFNPYTMNAFFSTLPNNFYAANNYQNLNQFYGNPVTPNDFKSSLYPQKQNFGYQKKNYNNNFKNDKKPYMKGIKQPREKNFKYNNKQVNAKSSKIEFNDFDFPPL